jgi:hypothetical protein
VKHRLIQFSFVMSLLTLGATNAHATLFSGMPTADGWIFGGDSLISGASYVGGSATNNNIGDGAAQYQLYSKTTTFTGAFLSECGATCAAWQDGDVIVGLGAVFPSIAGGGNQDNTGYVILKWGVTGATYSLSTMASPLGNGRRDHNAGQGGLRSVVATYNAPSLAIVGVTVGGATTAFQWAGVSGSAGTNIQAGNYIAFKTTVAEAIPGYNSLKSFEGYLNVTKLNFMNPLGSFTFNGNSIVGVRDGGSPSLETNALIAGVPEPATGFLAAGALFVGWWGRRRRGR